MKVKVLKQIPDIGKVTIGKCITVSDADAERYALGGYVEIVEVHKPSAKAVKERVAAALQNKNKQKIKHDGNAEHNPG